MKDKWIVDTGNQQTELILSDICAKYAESIQKTVEQLTDADINCALFDWFMELFENNARKLVHSEPEQCV